MKLVAFTGPAGSGKSTCAAHLARIHSYERCSFAAPIYAMLEAGGFGRPKTQEEKEAIIPHLGISWRHAAQTLGTDWGRKMIHYDVWVRQVVHMINPDGAYVIEDLRFENEATAVREAGGLIVHLTGRQHAMSADTKQHASEVGVAFVEGKDTAFKNAQGIEELEDFMDALHDYMSER